MAKYKRRRKLKKSVRRFFFLIFVFLLVLFIYKRFKKEININNIYLEDNKLHVKINSRFDKDIYCMLTEEEQMPSLNSDSWKQMNNNKECILEFNKEHYNLYVKKDNKIIYNNEYNKILEFNFDDNDKYYPVNGTYNLKYNYKYIGTKSDIKWKSNDSKIVTIDNGKIKTISDGIVTITAEFDGKINGLEIESTSLLAKKPKEYDYKKKYLPCDKYTKEENDKLDEILNYRAHQVGFKTRAAAVEVARFLTLEFPYRINYFYETGRLTQSNKIDGEGRYYHLGLYLHSSRYKSISKSTSSPKIWGCSLYDAPAKRNIDNGLDCSGFVSWVLLNAGFDVGDLGAGYSNTKNLSQSIGKLYGNSTSLMNSGKIKVGDLLHNDTGGGHIAMIVGIDKDNYYVAQALWYDEIGVIITKYTKSTLLSNFPHVVLMDKYYKEDGNLTNMWY